jgi:hypothetical protein
MTIHKSFGEFELNIARYRRLAREVTDPLAVCLLEIVIEDLEAHLLEADREERRPPPSNGIAVRPGEG